MDRQRLSCNNKSHDHVHPVKYYCNNNNTKVQLNGYSEVSEMHERAVWHCREHDVRRQMAPQVSICRPPLFPAQTHKQLCMSATNSHSTTQLGALFYIVVHSCYYCLYSFRLTVVYSIAVEVIQYDTIRYTIFTCTQNLTMTFSTTFT